ncbi:pyridoxamine 5'-phosphate oxidase family protein [Lentilactobacillus farraginis]|uniref:Flavin mononucleotide-binding protein n=2 Tax=Lentilactobacillus farraginis DSM 18382 = JCM 14108 TaxID=1423743 RepID=A0A0R1VSS2_9LACO|nr:pyridoxamine 5'-phosphate oxidase family protein [Lentilactobacillus farraginis]KRM08759.1 flavin mononucleotide-binding protein [Lentilactobacillus farraginis DSM 18382 = JCM 14108]
MDQKFLDVMKHEGVVTIVTINAQPAHVVNTWASYVKVTDKKLLIPAAGMHSIEQDFAADNHVTVAVGSKEVEGTQGPGAGFHVHGTGKFVDAGDDFDEMKAKFPWLSRVLEIEIDDIEQRI